MNVSHVKFLALFISAGAILAGCAANPPAIKLSHSEQQQIKEGKLVRFSDKIINQNIDPMKEALLGKVEIKKSTDRIFVCAVPNMMATDHCYPRLSEKIASYFADDGVTVESDLTKANKEVFVVLSYNYWGAAFDKTQLPTIEKSMETSNTLDIGADDPVADKKRQDKQIAEDRKNFLLDLAGVAVAAVAGGASSMQAANGVSDNTESSHIHGDAKKAKKVFWLELETKSSSDHLTFPTRTAAYIYTGPVDLRNSFAPLFDEALKSEARDIVVN